MQNHRELAENWRRMKSLAYTAGAEEERRRIGGAMRGTNFYFNLNNTPITVQSLVFIQTHHIMQSAQNIDSMH